ncbi:hypothetical protein [Bradyrhizobium guangxiense]|uniref:hypothetical protein n=1 Tax=Bradyrhizobium guangxiense TaxID=1325115 RepID=UPI0010093857|nr:hypothetical protein [Bradyrhizobium guangxiense]
MQRRLLVPSLASIGQESGFAVKTKATSIRVRTFQGGLLASVAEFDPAPIVRLRRSQWASHLPVSNDELNTVELVGEPGSESEGELLYRDGAQQVSVLTGLVPLRDAGFKFSPIVHQAHYNVLLPNVETFVVLANLVAESDKPARPNKMQVEIRNMSAQVLAVTEIDAGLNSTYLLPVAELARSHGIDPSQGLSLRIRGGASQFAVFTVFRNLTSGALGIEHSLPPIYFTEAPFNPALRGRFQKAAFGDLKL